MSYILKENFKKNKRYIYMVEYDKKPNEDYEVITKVYYFRWVEEENQFAKRYWSNKNFAKALYNGEFAAWAGKEEIDRLTNVVEVIAYKQDDGEYWIKTKADDSKENNLELLTYAKKYGFAKKV